MKLFWVLSERWRQEEKREREKKGNDLIRAHRWRGKIAHFVCNFIRYELLLFYNVCNFNLHGKCLQSFPYYIYLSINNVNRQRPLISCIIQLNALILDRLSIHVENVRFWIHEKSDLRREMWKYDDFGFWKGIHFGECKEIRVLLTIDCHELCWSRRIKNKPSTWPATINACETME